MLLWCAIVSARQWAGQLSESANITMGKTIGIDSYCGGLQ
jgi:hypothetical protein